MGVPAEAVGCSALPLSLHSSLEAALRARNAFGGAP